METRLCTLRNVATFQSIEKKYTDADWILWVLISSRKKYFSMFQHPSTKTKNFKKQHARFCDKLRLYHEEHGIAGLKLTDAIRAIQDGPYQQYKEAKMEGLEPEKNKLYIQKQKIRKYIKKIKIDNLKGDDNETHQSHVQTPSDPSPKTLVS